MSRKSVVLAAILAVICFGADVSGAAGLPRKSMIGLAVAPAPNGAPGVLVTAVVPGAPGARAGFVKDDLILTQDGSPAVIDGFPQRIAVMPAGRKVRFEVQRAGAKKTIEVVTAERPRDPGTGAYRVDYGDVATLGYRVRTLTSHPKTAGRHPALVFLPGLTSASIDIPLSGPDNDMRIVNELANAGYVTMRVDKPGLGDSEGGPYATLDYATEADAYRQALRALKQMPDVDSSRVYLFGHSMGGCFAPLLATETPIRGIAVYGTVGRTWHEYMIDVVRQQGLLAGQTYAQVDDSVRVTMRMLDLILADGQSPAQVAKAYPELAALVAENFPGDLYFGRPLSFWRQLFATNFAALWAKCGAHVLAVHGASDYVSYAVDHELIAKIVNEAHPGYGRYVSLPSVDHWLNDWPTQDDSQKNVGTGKYNPAVAKALRDWTSELQSATP
jgi:pimeloyl-ACP methyl ester carboxylesterase